MYGFFTFYVYLVKLEGLVARKIDTWTSIILQISYYVALEEKLPRYFKRAYELYPEMLCNKPFAFSFSL